VVRRLSPSDDPGWTDSRWTFETLTGDRCRWFSRASWPPKDAASPQTIVLIHGVVVSGSYFQPVAQLLDGQYRVVVPDLPGTGRSTTYRGRLGLEELAEALIWWLDQHDVADAVLVANSMGCQVLTHLVVRRPDLAKALVLVSPTMDPVVRSLIQVMWRGLRDLPLESPSLWPVWLDDLRRSNTFAGLATLSESIRDQQAERVAAITIPVHVVGGHRDPIVPPEWVREFANAFPNGTSTVIERAAHAINFSNPRELAVLIQLVADGRAIPRTMARLSP
jgi:pimeloyl-ACP methyl ester carboxylesterase